jgi:hypothetical protein
MQQLNEVLYSYIGWLEKGAASGCYSVGLSNKACKPTHVALEIYELHNPQDIHELLCSLKWLSKMEPLKRNL